MSEEASTSAWVSGFIAGKQYAEAWQNPYTAQDQPPMDGLAWHAGWCAGRQAAAAMGTP